MLRMADRKDEGFNASGADTAPLRQTQLAFYQAAADALKRELCTTHGVYISVKPKFSDNETPKLVVSSSEAIPNFPSKYLGLQVVRGEPHIKSHHIRAQLK